MTTFVHALSLFEILVFGGLATLAAWAWSRKRGAAGGWLAATFAAIAAVVVVAWPGMSPTAPRSLGLVKALVTLIIACPSLLYLFKRSLAGSPWWLDLAAGVLTGTALLETALLRSVPHRGLARGHPSLFVLLVVAQWLVVGGSVAVSLWRAGRAEPDVARRRMRTLSLGAAGLAVAILFGAATVRSAGSVIAVALIALGSGPLLLAAFMSPPLVARAWRRLEEKALQAAIEDLMTAATPAEVVEGLLPQISRIVGAPAAGLFDDDGTLLGIWGEPAADTPPLRVGGIGVWVGPYTPWFGREELELLHTLATLAGLTLQRCRVAEQESRAREDLQRAHADLEEAQHIARVGSWHWDLAEGTITWSAELYRLHGLDPATFHPTIEALQALLHPEDSPALAEAVRAAASEGTTFDTDFRIIRPSGEVRCLHALGRTTVTACGRRELIGTVQDVTEQRRLESARSEFIANAAHELRTPLTTLAGVAVLLARHRHDMSPAEADASFDALARQGQRAKVLIQNMLDLSRLDAAPPPVALKSVPLALAVARTLETVPEPPGTSVAVAVPEHLAALAEETQLEQILTNLLSNAYRYGGKRIRVEATSEAGQVLISVCDDGPGVPDELVGRMFEPFTRAQGAGGAVGSGLGLAISRRLVEAFNGSLTYEPAVPHGSRFTVALNEAA